MGKHKSFEVIHEENVHVTITPHDEDDEKLDVTVYVDGDPVETHERLSDERLFKLKSKYVDFVPVDPPTPES